MKLIGWCNTIPDTQSFRRGTRSGLAVDRNGGIVVAAVAYITLRPESS